MTRNDGNLHVYLAYGVPGSRPGPHGSEWRPNVDVYETNEGIVVVLEVAGVSEESVDIEVEGQRLMVRGIRAPILRAGTRRIHHLEIAQGRFQVAIELPASVDAESASARTREGLLEVDLPFAVPFRPRIGDGTGRDRRHD